MKIKELPLETLIPYAANPRKNSDAVDAVAASIKEFGWKQPIVIDKDNVIVAGHTRYKAAQKLGLSSAPCLLADDLTEQQVKAFRILDNKVAEKSEWDLDLLPLELEGLEDFDLTPFDVEFSKKLSITGEEIDGLFVNAEESERTEKQNLAFLVSEEEKVLCLSVLKKKKLR
jgi:ParB-like chromosome segregation protein Spo0J